MAAVDKPEAESKAEKVGAEAFPAERLIADAHDLVGYAPHEVAGALAGSGKTELTRAEAAELTKAWLATPAKTA